MDELLRACGACGRELEPDNAESPTIGLIEDGFALCRACATDADREYELPPLDVAA